MCLQNYIKRQSKWLLLASTGICHPCFGQRWHDAMLLMYQVVPLIQSMTRAKNKKIIFCHLEGTIPLFAKMRTCKSTLWIGLLISQRVDWVCETAFRRVHLICGRNLGIGRHFWDPLFESRRLRVLNTITKQYHHVYEYKASIADVAPLSKAIQDWKLIKP